MEMAKRKFLILLLTIIVFSRRRHHSLSNSEECRDTLNEDIQKYIDLSLASTTQQTYSSGEKRFVSFIHLYKRKQAEECMPASEALLTEFVAFLANPSIKAYLAAVRHAFPYLPWSSDKLEQNVTLAACLRGIKRSQGQQLRVRLPIAINHLRLFRVLLGVPFTQSFNSKMIWAAMTLAFFDP